MNKKAQQHALETIAKVFLIGLVLFLLIAVVLDLLKKSSGSATGLFDSWLEEFGLKKPERDLTTLNENAQQNFNLLIQEYTACLSNQKKDCACEGSNGFSDFSDIHKIVVDDNNKRTSLFIINNKNELLKDIKQITLPTCYRTPNGFNQLTSPLVITFDNNPILEDKNGREVELSTAFFIYYKKSEGEVCWLTKDILYGSLNTC